MEKQYSNREIDMYHKSINEKLDLILQQTTKTNGRVTRLENWKSWLIGYSVAMIPVVAWMAKQILTLIEH